MVATHTHTRNANNTISTQIYLRRGSCYGLPAGTPLSWAQITEAVRARGQIAIGVAPHVGGPEAMSLAPAVDESFVISDQDEIIVIAMN